MEKWTNNMNKVVLAIITIVISWGVLGGALPVRANNDLTANTLKVTPLRTDVVSDPGGTVSVKVIVTNPSNQDIEVRPIQNDFISGDENGNPAIILDENEFAPTRSLKRFLKPIGNVTIPANKSQTIEVAIDVPVEAKPGGYFGAIRFAPVDPDSGGQVNMSVSIASLILLTVNGDVPEKLDLTNFDIEHKGSLVGGFVVNPTNLVVSSRFKNDSNIQLAPFGKISVQKGEVVVYETDFNNKDPKDMILPDSARQWDTSLDGLDSFGKYTVKATFTYGSKNQTIEVEHSFWLITLPALIGGIVGTILVLGMVVGIVLVISRRNRRISF